MPPPEPASEKVENHQIEGDSAVASSQYVIDPAIEKRVVRKLDMRVVPMVMALCE